MQILSLLLSSILVSVHCFPKFHSISFSKSKEITKKDRWTLPSSCKIYQKASSRFLMSSRCEVHAELIKNKPRWGGPLFGPIREKTRGLLTVSNHQSFYDDPGIWTAFLPLWRMRPEQVRWSLCTEDVFFANKWMTRILGGGNVIPLDRSGSIDQPLFKRFHEKLVSGSWCHIFAEGKVRQSWRFEDQEPHLGDFKVGVGKLVAHCPADKSPIVIPMYHDGMDTVLPEVVLKDRKTRKPSKPQSYIPRTGKQIKVLFGEPLDFTAKVAAFREKHPGLLDQWAISAEGLELYADIAKEIRAAVLMLEAEAKGRNQQSLEPDGSTASAPPAPAPALC